MNNDSLITVFTPVYNRAYIIAKCYESLKRQTFKDFEWLIYDDGSTDDIEEVVNNFIKEGLVK
ncbi:glycosyltransferase family 2 protein [Clostridium perfringens]|nr:glycosyltransferase family 2 protein [Clostridium perfringens]